MKNRIEKIYRPQSISSLAKYLGITTASLHKWKRGVVGKFDNANLELIMLGLDKDIIVDNHTKFELVMQGWNKLCEKKLAEAKKAKK